MRRVRVSRTLHVESLGMTLAYDAILLVSFGGPEGPDDVIPFLENVLRGRNVPHERMMEVAQHYQQFGGVSPINEQNRELIAALRSELDANDVSLPIYWGNRNWHPLLEETVREMADDGRLRALAILTSANSSYSSCRQYQEDLDRSVRAVGASAPRIDKVRQFWNHPGFVEASIDRVRDALAELPKGVNDVRLALTAHSIPVSMASHCGYVEQLTELSRLIAEAVGLDQWELVFQSRSGPPHVPWLEPDICDHLKSLADHGAEAVVVAPIGFVSDHMEVVYDLDYEARQAADECGLLMTRARTVGTHPRFVSGLSELIDERINSYDTRPVLGNLPACADHCADDCCPLRAVASSER